MNKPNEAEVKVAITKILQDTKAYSTSLNWAVNYCKAAIQMSGEDLKVQCLYILGNITHWRHKDAKEVRVVLKAFTKS